MKHIDAKFRMMGEDTPILGKSMIGFIYEDKKGRFADGDNVMTSVVMEISKTEEATIVTTRNTVYQLV
jgi:hypothetical protein